MRLPAALQAPAPPFAASTALPRGAWERDNIGLLLGGNPPDSVAAIFREPQIAIGAGRDAIRIRVGRDADTELGDHPSRGNPPDLVALMFREPKVAIGANRDSNRAGVGRDTDAELGGHPGRGYPPDPVTVGFREPQVAIGAERDGIWKVVGRGADVEFRAHPGGGHPPDHHIVVNTISCRPNVAIGTSRDA